MPATTATFDRTACGECGSATSLRVLELDPKLGEAGPIELVCDDCPWTLYVPAETTARTRIEALRRIVADHAAARVDGYLVDALTANALVTVYAALSRESKERFGIPDLSRLVEFAWKRVR